jgi:hypothetical protein
MFSKATALSGCLNPIWAIHTDEPPKDVWQKLKCYTEPNEYLVMFPLDASLWTSQDRKALQWILARP